MVVSIPVRVLGVLERNSDKFAHGSFAVSIPVRVLGVLERASFSARATPAGVSIPVRVLGVLEPMAVIPIPAILQFQSL